MGQAMEKAKVRSLEKQLEDRNRLTIMGREGQRWVQRPEKAERIPGRQCPHLRMLRQTLPSRSMLG